MTDPEHDPIKAHIDASIRHRLEQRLRDAGKTDEEIQAFLNHPEISDMLDSAIGEAMTIYPPPGPAEHPNCRNVFTNVQDLADHAIAEQQAERDATIPPTVDPLTANTTIYFSGNGSIDVAETYAEVKTMLDDADFYDTLEFLRVENDTYSLFTVQRHSIGAYTHKS